MTPEEQKQLLERFAQLNQQREAEEQTPVEEKPKMKLSELVNQRVQTQLAKVDKIPAGAEGPEVSSDPLQAAFKTFAGKGPNLAVHREGDAENPIISAAAAPVSGVVTAGAEFANVFGADIDTEQFQPDTGIGKFVSSVTQVMLPGMMYFKALKAGATAVKAYKAIKSAKLLDFGLGAAAGAMTDITVLPADANISSMLKDSFPELADNPIVDTLSIDQSDSEFEGRLKNVVEGLALGGASSVIFPAAAKGLRSVIKAAKKFGVDSEQVAKAAHDGTMKIKKLLPKRKTVKQGVEKTAPSSEIISSARNYLETGKMDDVLDQVAGLDITAADKSVLDFIDSMDDITEGVIGTVNARKRTEIEAGAMRYVKNLFKMHDDDEVIKTFFNQEVAIEKLPTKIVSAKLLTQVTGEKAQKALLKFTETGLDADKVGAENALQNFMKINAFFKTMRSSASNTFREAGGVDESVKKLSDLIDKSVKGSKVKLSKQELAAIADDLSNMPDSPEKWSWLKGVAESTRGVAEYATSLRTEALLSGWSTMSIVQLTTATINSFMFPLYKWAGRGGVSQSARRGLAAEYGQFLHSWRDMWHAMKNAPQYTNAIVPEEGLLTASRNYLPYLKQLEKQSNSHIKAGIYRSMYAFEWLKSLPSRTIGRLDAGTKVLIARQDIADQVVQQAMKDGITDGKIITDMIEEATSNAFSAAGRLRTQKGLWDEARRAALNKKLKGKEASKFINEYITEQSYKLQGIDIEGSLKRAEIATVTNPLNPKGVGGQLDKIRRNSLILKFLEPFARTSINLLDQGTDLVAGVNLLKPSLRRALNSADPVEKAIARGKLSTSVMVAFPTAYAGSTGLITGSIAPDEKTNLTLYKGKWRPNTLWVKSEDGTLVEGLGLSKLAPINIFLSFWADLGVIASRGDEFGAKVVSDYLQLGSMSMANMVGNNAPFQMVTKVLDSVHSGDLGPIERELTNLPASFIPRAIDPVKQVADQFQREVRDPFDAIINKIPGASHQLPVRRDWAGRPVQNIGRPIFNALSPVLSTRIEKTPTDIELEKIGFHVEDPSVKFQGVDLTSVPGALDNETAYDTYTRLIGEVRIHGRNLEQAVSRAVKSSKYQKLTKTKDPDLPNPRAEMVKKLVRQYRAEAKDQLVRQVPQLRQISITKQQMNKQAESGASEESLRLLQDQIDNLTK